MSACRGVAARSMCAVRRGGEVVGVVVGDAVGGLAFVEFGFFYRDVFYRDKPFFISR